LGGLPLIALPRGAGIRRLLDAACARAGVVPRIAFEATTPRALVDLAERGLGVAVVPSSAARDRPGVRVLALEPELRGRLVWVWRADGPLSPAARALVARARRLGAVGADA